MAGEYIVKAATKGEILIPRTLHKEGDNPVLCLINLSDHQVELEKGKYWLLQKRCVRRGSSLEYKR
jgi:hypothetical protein